MVDFRDLHDIIVDTALNIVESETGEDAAYAKEHFGRKTAGETVRSMLPAYKERRNGKIQVLKKRSKSQRAKAK